MRPCVCVCVSLCLSVSLSLSSPACFFLHSPLSTPPWGSEPTSASCARERPRVHPSPQHLRAPGIASDKYIYTTFEIRDHGSSWIIMVHARVRKKSEGDEKVRNKQPLTSLSRLAVSAMTSSPIALPSTASISSLAAATAAGPHSLTLFLMCSSNAGWMDGWMDTVWRLM